MSVYQCRLAVKKNPLRHPQRDVPAHHVRTPPNVQELSDRHPYLSVDSKTDKQTSKTLRRTPRRVPVRWSALVTPDSFDAPSLRSVGQSYPSSLADINLISQSFRYSHLELAAHYQRRFLSPCP